jgi:hypothetical protein
MATSFATPATTLALREAAEFIRTSWIAAAERLPVSQRRAYIAGLSQPGSVVYNVGGDPLVAMVVNVAPEAEGIELGTPPIHLPEVIRWGQARSARRSKDGRYYLVVPFGHTTPRSGTAARRPSPARMSWPVYRVARQLQPGQRLSAGPSRGRAVHAPGTAPYVPQNPRNVRPGYTHAALHEGLRRGLEPRRGRSSAYTTFRTMTQESPGWWLPARPGTKLLADVERQVMPQVNAMLEVALRQDIADALQRAGGGTP